jgi:5'-nucleotidase
MDMSQTPPTPSGIVDFIVTGGVVLNPNKTYRVTVNDFLAKGGNNFTLLKDGINPVEGVSDIDALATYLEPFKFPKPSYDPNSPNLNKPRIIQLPLP